MNAPDLLTPVRLGGTENPQSLGDGPPGPGPESRADDRDEQPTIAGLASRTTPMTSPNDEDGSVMLKRIGIATDHGGFELKEFLAGKLRTAGYEVMDFGDDQLRTGDDYPDYIIPLARAVADGTVERGVGICGSGVGACITANKVPGVRACLIDELVAARQSVEDDDLNLICLGGRLTGHTPAWELVRTFLAARFKGAERARRRLAKVDELENTNLNKIT